MGKNILHLQTELNLTCGVTKTIYLISKNLNDGFKQFVLTLGGDAVTKFTDIKISVSVINLKRKSIFGSIRIFYMIFKYCKKNDIDIIHSHHRYFDFISYIISLFLPIKTICTVQSKVYGYSLFSYKSNKIIAVSQTIKKHLMNNFNITVDKISVVNNFVDAEEIKTFKRKDELKAEIGIPENVILIGYMGRFNIKEKGIDVLLEAYKRIYEEMPDIWLILIGEGTDRIFINNFIKRYNLPIKILQSQKMIFDYYNICDVIVLPSRIDPFPLMMLETGLVKKPFIGSKVDGIAEFIDDGIDGLLFEPGNVQDLIYKLKELISDNNKSAFLAQNLYKKVINYYTSDKIIPKYLELYKTIINV